MTTRNETLVESTPRDLHLTLEEARALSAAGTRLALRRVAVAFAGDDEDEDPSLIKCVMNPNGTWRVTVSDAIGLIAVGNLRLLVEPKIPRSHLFYLFGRADILPRIDATKAAAAKGDHLWELICRWLIERIEHVLRRDLIRDYLPFRDDLVAARGQIDPLATGGAYYRGTLRIVCDFEEFGSDTPLNRVLKAAATAVAGSVDASPSTRRRARAAAARMDDVGSLEPTDLRVQTDRRTGHYGDALTLARTVLSNDRRTLAHGDAMVWTFLIRTPQLVEAGVRRELRERLLDSWHVRKEPIPLTGANMTVSPDLLFGFGAAIADVKYKRARTKWLRPDLYEVTTFATAAGTTRAAVIGFRRADEAHPPTIGVGGTVVRFFSWLADEAVAPSAAAEALAKEIEAWLDAA